jgi:steroid 5-alpha reductase family enzyme
MGLSDTRSLVLCAMVSAWGLRLGLHLAIRNLGHGEDYRYQVWRKEHGKNWWWVSYLRVFLLQGVILWIVSSALLVGLTPAHGQLQWLDWVGVALWGVGFYFEAVGDWQLTQFKKNPNNKGQLLQTGLWALTRHPNYFGDALLWWGYFCFACANGAFAYVFSPVLMTFLLMKVSGVALLEQTLSKTKPQFDAYQKRVPAFFPRLF